jgi:uncharacterized RDD family membrane protein YckC
LVIIFLPDDFSAFRYISFHFGLLRYDGATCGTSSMSLDPTDQRAAGPALGDQLSIATPELVAIEFPLAGLGSRFVAILLDYLLQGFTLFLLILIFVVFFSGVATPGIARARGNVPEKWGIAIAIAIPFLLEWGYFTLFEAFWRGQTPGKRIMRIRVIQQTGRPVSLFESMGRNLVRVVDFLPPPFYVVGVITMFVTRRQQRLGDLIAGTLVVHERKLETPLESIGGSRTFTAGVFKQAATTPTPRESSLPADAVAMLTLADLQALESYLARRLDFPVETRTLLAGRMSENIARKMNFAIPAGMSQETFLEETAFALRSMPNLRR